jgi:hypothetical protein
VSEPKRPDRTERLIGAGLTAIGALIFALCGLCTLGGAGTLIIATIRNPSNAAGFLGSVLLCAIGLLPTFGGLLLMRIGWQMYKGKPVDHSAGAAKAAGE